MPSPADMYPKVGYPTDSHEMQPLQTSLGTAAPLPLISEEHAQQQQPMRQPSYPYTAGAPSGSTPRQMPMAMTTAGLPATTTTAAAPPDDTSLARFVGGDDRPLKRNTGPQGITGSDTEYRYGPYGGVPATTQGYSPTRDVYARGTSTAGQSPTTTVGPYGTAGSDPRAYAVTPYDAYDRTRRDDVRKLDEGQTGHGHSPVHPGEYGQHRGSFDAMSHYSWNNP